jgi:uncharacterized sulfatase
LDGVDLMPYLLGEKKGNPHDALFWRWRSQAAVLADHWKLILLGKDERYLFDMDSPEGETKNRLAEYPDIAAELDRKLMAWNATLPPPGLPRDIVDQDQVFYDDHVNKTGVASTKRPRKESGGKAAETANEWVARNANAEVKDGALHVAASGKQSPFIAFTGLSIPGPAVATASVRAEKGGKLGIAWRLDGQKDFTPAQAANQDFTASSEFQEVTVTVPAEGSIIHLRLLLPDGTTDVRRLELKAANGKQAKQWTFEARK